MILQNRSSGADEAFKILSKAFDAIGTPDVRNKYNIANLHKNPLVKMYYCFGIVCTIFLFFIFSSAFGWNKEKKEL